MFKRILVPPFIFEKVILTGFYHQKEHFGQVSSFILDGLHSLVPPTDTAIFMGKKNITLPLTVNGGELSMTEEEITIHEKTEMRPVITWSKLEEGEKWGQWLGFRSDLFKNIGFEFNALIKFVGEKPPESHNFGLKVCGTFYNQLLTSCVADKWCVIKEYVHCDGGYDILLVFNTVEKMGQQVKMSDVYLREVGKLIYA